MNEYLRLAVQEDLDLLFEWANDEEVRRNSFSTEKISYEEHKCWFQKLMKEENSRQYIFCVNQIAVGQVRVTVQGSKAEIGYSICKLERGKSYGKKMLQVLKLQLKKDFPKVDTLIAKVKAENLASQKVFLGSGYKEIYRQYELRF